MHHQSSQTEQGAVPELSVTIPITGDRATATLLSFSNGIG